MLLSTHHHDNNSLLISSKSTLTPTQSIHSIPHSSVSSYSSDSNSRLSALQHPSLNPTPPPPKPPPPLSSPASPPRRSQSVLGLRSAYLLLSPSHHHPKRSFHSRFLSSMSSQESGQSTQTTPSTASAPSTFRSLKSRIFASTPFKPKHPQTSQLNTPPNSSQPRNVYMFLTSSDQLDHLPQTLNPDHHCSLVRQRSKSNNTALRHQEPEPHPTTKAEQPIDQSRSGPSIDLPRNPRSIELQRATLTQPTLHALPNSRALVDVNSNRVNYRYFNNKNAIQNGPRILRLNANPSAEQQSLPSLTTSHRSTPIPHGGSAALLTFNPSNSIRSSNTRPQPIALVDLPPSMAQLPLLQTSTSAVESVSAGSEALSLDIEHLVSPQPAIRESQSLETLNKSLSEKPTRELQSLDQLEFLHEQSSWTSEPSPHNILPDLTPRLIPSSSSTSINSTCSNTTADSYTALFSRPVTSPKASDDSHGSPEPTGRPDVLFTRQQSFELDLAEFSSFLSYPDASASKPDPRPPRLRPGHHGKPTSRPPSLPSTWLLPTLNTSIYSKPLMTSIGTLTLSPPKLSSQQVSTSLPVTPMPFTHSVSPFATSSHASVVITSPAAVALPQPHTPKLDTRLSTAALSPPPSAGPSPTATSKSFKAGSHLSASLSSPSDDPTSTSLQSPLPSQVELQRARKLIAGLQKEVEQLKNAQSVSPASKLSSCTDLPRSPSSPNSAQSHMLDSSPQASKNLLQQFLGSASSADIPAPVLAPRDDPPNSDPPLESERPSDPAPQPSPPADASVPAPTTKDDHLNPELPLESEGPSELAPQLSPGADTSLPASATKDDPPNSDSPLQQSEQESEHALQPSRLPVAKYRLQGKLSSEFARSNSLSSTSGRTWKISVGSNGSNEYRCAPSDSFSTSRTTTSHVSNSLKSKAYQPSDIVYPDLIESSTQLSKKNDSRNHVSRSFVHSRALSITSHSSSSSSQFALPSIIRNRRDHGAISSVSSQSMHSGGSLRSESVLGSLPEHARHHPRRQMSRPGLSSVEENMVLNEELEEAGWATTSKAELVAMIEDQRTQFAIERQELLDALRRSREKVSQTSREREMLRAEDGWKTEQLNKAREEISWLSRLADTLELEKSMLESRVTSLGNELKRSPNGSRRGLTPTSKSYGPAGERGMLLTSPSRNHNLGRSPATFNFIGRSSNSNPLSRATSTSTYSLPTVTHRSRHLSGDSVATVCPNETSPKVHGTPSHNDLDHAISSWRARESPVPESDPIGFSPREYSTNKQGYTPSQRSASDLRVPASPLIQRSPRSDHVESFVSRQRRYRPPLSHLVPVQRVHPEYASSEAGSSEDEGRGGTIIEEHDNQAHHSEDYPDHRALQHPSYPDESEQLDYQDVAYEIGAHKGHARANSTESLAISPSSTVFADHQRNDPRYMSMYRRPTDDLEGGSQSQSRNSLMSLRLRPEDEIFLENYLDDGETGSDDDF